MYTSLIVGLNETRRLDALMESAAAIARDSHAPVTGLYVLPAMRSHPGARFEPLPVMFEDLRRHFADHAETVRSAFEAAVSRLGIEGRFRLVDSRSPLISDTFAACARHFDLAVISEVDQAADFGVELDFVPSVLFACGRPVLVVPRAFETLSPASTAVVGWNGSRESARAVFDALPLLRSMDKVYLLTIGLEDQRAAGDPMDGEDLKETLSRQCRHVVLQSIPGDVQEAGSVLLAKSAELRARLLIMGAYGRSRLSELVLGGATQQVLAGMKLAVLFSH